MVYSVVMPVYNKAPHLEKAVASVLAQAHLRELIVVDDGSTDGSGDILDRLAENNTRLCIIHQKNGGVSAARNEGIKRVTGEYLCFVDGDDTLDKDFFEKAFKETYRYKPDIAFFSYEKIYADKESQAVPSPIEGVVDTTEALSVLHAYQEKTGYFGCVTNKILKADIAKQCRFDPSIKLAEDLDFWVQVMQIAQKCCFSQVFSFSYYQEQSCSSCFAKVDYLSQLKLRLRYRNLLLKYAPHIDLVSLNSTISHYVYFAAADACTEGIKSGKRAVLDTFKCGLAPKELYIKKLPFFHKICLFFIKHGLITIGVAAIRTKQKLKGQTNA